MSPQETPTPPRIRVPYLVPTMWKLLAALAHGVDFRKGDE